MRRFSDFSSWCLIQVTDVFREKNTEQDTRVLRGDTLCTHKGTHTTGSTLALGYTDEGAPLSPVQDPLPWMCSLFGCHPFPGGLSHPWWHHPRLHNRYDSNQFRRPPASSAKPLHLCFSTWRVRSVTHRGCCEDWRSSRYDIFPNIHRTTYG